MNCLDLGVGIVVVVATVGTLGPGKHSFQFVIKVRVMPCESAE